MLDFYLSVNSSILALFGFALHKKSLDKFYLEAETLLRRKNIYTADFIINFKLDLEYQ